MKPLTICFITEDFYPSPIGGQGIYGQHLVEELAKLGHTVAVFAEQRGDRLKYWRHKHNITIHVVPFCFGNQLILAITEYVSFLWQFRGQSVDIVHANQLSGLLFCYFKPKNVGKVVVTVHNTFADMYGTHTSRLKRYMYTMLSKIERVMYRKADVILFHNTHEKQQFFQTFGELKNRYYIAQIGISNTKFTHIDKILAKQEICRQFSIKKSSKIILFVGRLVRRKNVDLLMKAVNDLKDITCIIVGDGRDRAILQSVMQDNVRFTGRVNDTKTYYLAADSFALLSDAEGGVALSVLEAAAYKLPVVVSLSAASFNIIQAVNGFVVNPKNTHEVSDAICLAVTSPGIGKRAYDSIRLFTWRRCALETVHAYQ